MEGILEGLGWKHIRKRWALFFFFFISFGLWQGIIYMQRSLMIWSTVLSALSSDAAYSLQSS